MLVHTINCYYVKALAVILSVLAVVFVATEDETDPCSMNNIVLFVV